MPHPKLILIAGPTASGKSALALDLARKHNGTVINADAMQVYAGLPTLTAQPTPEEQKEIPHMLYGVVDPAERFSAGKWLALARQEIATAAGTGRTPILVGGTGLYFKALLGGLADIPEIPEDARDDAQQLYDKIGEEKFRAKLVKLDPESAARLARNDRQRLIRAYEVAKHTGKPIGEWQSSSDNKSGGIPPPLRGRLGGGVAQQEAISDVAPPSAKTKALLRNAKFSLPPPQGGRELEVEPHLLMPPRDELYAACDRRFEKMITQGALNEVREFLDRNLDPVLPSMKTIGVREIGAYMNGEISLEPAIVKAQQATRNFAKRQMTWFRNQW